MKRYDAIVIGTGFGGAVTAARLAQAARSGHGAAGKQIRSVLILERGRRYEQGDFPRPPLPDLLPGMKPGPGRAWSTEGLYPDVGYKGLSWQADGGLWDLRQLGGLQAVGAAGLGGGSLIYANVHIMPPKETFEGWPWNEDSVDRLRADWFPLAGHMLRAKPMPFALPKSRGFAKAIPEAWAERRFMPRLAVTFDGPPPEDVEDPVKLRAAMRKPAEDNPHGVAQSPCVHCGECVMGCNEGAKNTLDKNYLAIAEGRGGRRLPEDPVTLLTSAYVTELRRRERGYSVHWEDRLVPHNTEAAWAPHVFVCAGSLGSTELLLRSREALQIPKGALPKLGGAFSANGDATAAVFDTTHRHKAWMGPTITSAIAATPPRPSGPEANIGPETQHPDLPRWEGEEEAWFLLEDGGLPLPLLKAFGWLGGRPREGLEVLEKDEENPAPMLVEQVQALLQGLTKALIVFSDPGLARARGEHSDTTFDNFVAHCISLGRRLSGGAIKRVQDAMMDRIGEELDRGLQQRFVLLPDGIVRWIRECFVRWAMTDLDDASGGTPFGRRMAKEVGKLVTEEVMRAWRFDTAHEHRAVFLVMGREQHAGHLHIAEDGRLSAEWEVDRNRGLYRAQERLMRLLSRAQEGKLRINLVWQLTDRPITVHPQGGCPMGRSEAEGVVDEWGTVFGLPGLVVSDAAIFPESVGVNPSATIMAVAERNIAHHIEHITGEAFQPPELTEEVRAAFHEPLEDLDAPVPPLEEPLLGLTFDEAMVGYLHAFEPEEEQRYTPRRLAEIGQRVGRISNPEKTRAEFRLKVRVPDLEYFLHAVEHGADRFRPRSLPVLGTFTLGDEEYRVEKPSVLRLFPVHWTEDGPWTDGPHGERMEYELYLAREGELSARLHACKDISDGPGFDVLHDTTVTYTQFVQPLEGGGEARRWGQMKVHTADLLSLQVPSFDVTGTDDAAEKALVLARFFRFFFGKLGQVYLRRALELLDNGRLSPKERAELSHDS